MARWGTRQCILGARSCLPNLIRPSRGLRLIDLVISIILVIAPLRKMVKLGSSADIDWHCNSYTHSWHCRLTVIREWGGGLNGTNNSIVEILRTRCRGTTKSGIVVQAIQVNNLILAMSLRSLAVDPGWLGA